MPRLIDHFRANTHFRILDAKSDQEFDLDAVLKQAPEFHTDTRSLVLMYLDNGLESLSALLSGLESPHALALFNRQLTAQQKEALETEYQPTLMFDQDRPAIEGYDIKQDHLFVRSEEVNCTISEQIKVLLSTSGSTGSPKLVKLSESNLISNAESIARYLPIVADDVCPLNLPLTYSYGLSLLTSNGLAGGKVVCGTEDVMNPFFWKVYEKHGFTSLAGVPVVYEILKRFKFTARQHPSLRYLTQAGGKMSVALINEFGEFARSQGIQLFVMYGQTEATARMSYLDPEQLPEKAGSIGKSIANGSFRIDENSGELVYAGPNVFGGYANTKEDLETYDAPEELFTGDLATIDDEGFYFITARTKRFVKLDGSRINLDELETFLLGHFSATGFRCVGLNDESLLTVSDQHLSQNDVARALSSEYKIRPAKIRFMQLDQMPQTANGKVDDKALKSLGENS